MVTRWQDWMAAKQLRKTQKKSRYGIRRKQGASIEIDGKIVTARTWDSGWEREFYQELCLREKAGEVKDVEVQVQTYLSAARIGYKVDFAWFDIREQRQLYAEIKGAESEVWRLKRRLWKAYGLGPLEVWRKPDPKGKLKLMETIMPLWRPCETCGQAVQLP